jgi:hypothetical protein
VPEQLAPPLALGEEAEEHAIGLQHLAALDQRQPVVQARLEGAVEGDGLLIGPVALGRQDRRIRIAPRTTPAVVAGHLAEELVPRVEPVGTYQTVCASGRYARADGSSLGKRKLVRALSRQWSLFTKRTNPSSIRWMIRHVRVGRVDAHGLADDLGARPAGAHEVVVHRAGPDLVARQDALFELAVKASGLVHGSLPRDGQVFRSRSSAACMGESPRIISRAMPSMG